MRFYSFGVLWMVLVGPSPFWSFRSQLRQAFGRNIVWVGGKYCADHGKNNHKSRNPILANLGPFLCKIESIWPIWPILRGIVWVLGSKNGVNRTLTISFHYFDRFYTTCIFWGYLDPFRFSHQKVSFMCIYLTCSHGGWPQRPHSDELDALWKWLFEICIL